MKNIFLIFILLSSVLVGKAQYPAFDTFYVYHPPQISGCPMNCLNLDAYNYRKWKCPPYNDDFKMESPGFLSGDVAGKNNYGTQAVAQHYHFDSVTYVCGIALLTGYANLAAQSRFYVRLLDENFDSLARALLRMGFAQGESLDHNGYRHFYFGTAIPVQEFYCAGDIADRNPSISSPSYRMTEGHNDSCVKNFMMNRWGYGGDTLDDGRVYCYFDDSPYFMKDNQWIRFADDTVYELYQGAFIEILPIIMVLTPTVEPEDSCSCDNCSCDGCLPCCDTCENSLVRLNLDKACSIYPNPAKDELTITSDYNIKALEIYNELGVKVRETLLNTQKVTINISELASGSYILKLQTSKGTITKKFVKK